GDTNSREIQVEQTRKLDSSDHGQNLFERANPGSTSYLTQAHGNTGTAVLSAPSGNSTAAGAFPSYTITFTSETDYEITAGGVTTQGSLDGTERQRIELPGKVSVQI